MKINMQNYTLIFTSREEVAQGTFKYIFEKPDGFEYVAGQYVILEIPNPAVTDDRPSFRSLSLSSAPHEDRLAFIMRHSDSGFKQSLYALKEGNEIFMKGPLGHMRLPEDEAVPVVFLTAGVGITPARSMLLDAQHRGSKRDFTLIYANREPNSTACMDEVTKFQLEKYSCIHIMSNAPQGWDGRTGRLDEQLLSQIIPDYHKPVFYIIGTKGFVNAMKEILASKDVSKENILIDNFG